MTISKEQYVPGNLSPKYLLRKITEYISNSFTLEDILNMVVKELRSYLDTDRIMIYRFHADESGQVIAESTNDSRLPSLLGLNFPADDIPPHSRQLFIHSQIRSIVNVETQTISQIPLSSETSDSSPIDSYSRQVDQCHIQYLQAMGVKSSIVTPIIYQEKLWGLVVSHHSQPRSVIEEEIEVIQLIAEQVSVAIAHDMLLNKTKEVAKKEAAINRISYLLHSLDRIQLQSALEETVYTFNGSAGRLYIASEEISKSSCVDKYFNNDACPGEKIQVYTYNEQPNNEQLIVDKENEYAHFEEFPIWQKYFSNGDRVWAISDIYKTPSLNCLKPVFQTTRIRGVLIIALEYRQKFYGYLTIFRNEFDTCTFWAGERNPDVRQDYPRLSFQAWQECHKGQVNEWTDQDIELAKEVGKRFANAIAEYQLHEKLQALNVTLESQVRERTSKLRESYNQQKILFDVVTKIRDSLDVNTIITTVIKELRQTLKADRVGIYRFEPNSEYNEGKFISEDIGDGIPSAIEAKIKDRCFGDNYANLYAKGRVHFVDDIYNAGLSECHIAILEPFKVKAKAVAPIVTNQELWGLLCVHQCDNPRKWQESEVNFITQVAVQISIAIEHAALFAESVLKTEQLNKILQNLKNTQTQLIQTEKMSSLGQLVAGVAHEINNPVNFIHGNLNHITQYIEDLLMMISLYEEKLSKPDEEILEKAEEIDLEFIVEDLPKMLDSMKLGTKRIRQIVLSLQNFSRLDQAQLKSVNIHEGIDSTLMILQHRFKTKSENLVVEVVKEYDDNLPLIECYAGQVNQVFMNILSNAIDALELGNAPFSQKKVNKTINIKTSTGKINGTVPSIVVRIADNGSGIPDKIKNKIFDPFFTTKEIGTGTGLGLSISYQIVVEKHQGVLHCKSKPGHGTEFWIEIPVRGKF